MTAQDVPAVSQTFHVQQDIQDLSGIDNVVADSSFEAGRPPSQTNWIGTNPAYLGGSPILSPAEGGPNANLSRTGTYFLILGSSPDALDSGVTQQVGVGAGAYTLSFYLRAGVNPGSDSEFSVEFDGTEVFRVTPATAATYAAYTEVSLPVAVAAAGTYTLAFRQTKTATPLINWIVDDVSMRSVSGGVSNADDAGASASSLVAYPNPMSSAASVRFTADASQDISVVLYDVTGRQVATLFQGAVSADQDVSVALDASSLPAGVYVVRATGTTLNLTQRVTVVR